MKTKLCSRHCRLAALLISSVAAGFLPAAAAPNTGGNVASPDNGAFIVFSSPLAHGVSPNFLIQDSSRGLSFANKSGPNLFVLDLGKNYAVDSFDLKFGHPTKFEIFILSAPPGNGDWSSVIGTTPDFTATSTSVAASLGKHRGRFIVFVTLSDPGVFFGLYITGDPLHGGNFFGPFGPGEYAKNVDEGNFGPLSERPFPSSFYQPSGPPSSP